MTTTPFQAPAGLWPSILAESQPSISPCQHYPPTLCAKAQDQSPSPKPEQLPSLSAKYLAPLPGLLSFPAAVVKSAKVSSPSVNPFSPLPHALQVPVANIISSAEGFSFLILQRQSWSFPQKGFYAVLMRAVGCSVSVKVVGPCGQDEAPLTKPTSLSAWGSLWGLRSLFTATAHGCPEGTFQTHQIS